jgi:TetR/AcrR family transcriptional regulator, cholesterol catabolism regulator
MDAQTTDGPQLGRRERNKLKVRERLYTSALTLFTEQGYDETSIDQIADRADVARGTFFNYFQRKEDLIDAWGDERREKLSSELAAGTTPGAGAEARLRQAMSTLGRLNELERRQTIAMLTAWVRAGRPLLEEPYVASVFASIVADGRERGEFRADLPVTQTGNLVRDLYFGALYRWCGRRDEQEQPGRLTQELQSALDLLLHGITAANRVWKNQP